MLFSQFSIWCQSCIVSWEILWLSVSSLVMQDVKAGGLIVCKAMSGTMCNFIKCYRPWTSASEARDFAGWQGHSVSSIHVRNLMVAPRDLHTLLLLLHVVVAAMVCMPSSRVLNSHETDESHHSGVLSSGKEPPK